MRPISISHFKPIDAQFPDFLYLRVDERVCSTRYLVRHKTVNLLIDAGDGKDELDFVPDVVFLTHGHYDHTRGVKSDWPQVFIHPAEDAALPYIFIPPNSKPLPGQSFEFGPYKFNIIPTPGHTPGSMCMFEEKTKFLFSGDTKFANGGRGRTDLGGSESEILESLEILKHIEWKVLCPGHGELEFF